MEIFNWSLGGAGWRPCWCPTLLCERLRIISHVYHTQKGSGEVSFNLHGPVLYGPAERAVCTLKRITTAHSSTLHISLSQSRPSPGFITPVPRLSASGWVHGWPSSCRTVKHPSEGPTGSTFEDIPAQFPIEFCCHVLLPLRKLKVPSVSDLHPWVPLGIVRTEEMATAW